MLDQVHHHQLLIVMSAKNSCRASDYEDDTAAEDSLLEHSPPGTV